MAITTLKREYVKMDPQLKKEIVDRFEKRMSAYIITKDTVFPKVVEVIPVIECVVEKQIEIVIEQDNYSDVFFNTILDLQKVAVNA